jgi:hypothetical protein
MNGWDEEKNRYCRQQSAAGGSALPPGKAAKAPAAQAPAVRLIVRVALKTFEDVERLQSEFGSPARRGDRPNATSAHEDGFFPWRDQCTDLIIVSSVHDHARPLLPNAHRCTRDKPDPLPLCIASHIDQHGLAGLPPLVGHFWRNIARIPFNGTDGTNGTVGAGGCMRFVHDRPDSASLGTPRNTHALERAACCN